MPDNNDYKTYDELDNENASNNINDDNNIDNSYETERRDSYEQAGNVKSAFVNSGESETDSLEPEEIKQRTAESFSAEAASEAQPANGTDHSETAAEEQPNLGRQSNYYDGYSGVSQNTGSTAYTTVSENNGGTASYEWNNGQYSGKYSSQSYNQNQSGSSSYGSYSGEYRYGNQPYRGYSSGSSNTSSGSYSGYSGQNSQNGYSSSSADNSSGSAGHYSGAYGSGYSGTGGYYNQTYVNPASRVQKPPKKKKEKKQGRVSAAVLVICILISGVLGFGGGMVANYINGSGSSGNGMTINKVVTTAEEASSVSGDMSTSDIVKATKDSVVEITTEIVTTGDFLQQYIESGAGSGVIISENGYIITNNHVIEDATTITVTLTDGTSYKASLVGRDADLDVALIKIDATGLDPAEIGDSSAIEIGDKAVVIGNPLGQLGGSVTDGIISAVNRNVMIDGVSHNVIQTNAAINPGNSGGGMFNGKGELIGLIVAKSVDESVEGIGFAIPINDVSDILEDLMQYGYVRGKVSLGMSFVDITNAQTAMMYRVNELGCYISSVEINSNAANAGFQSGDLVKSVNGTSVSTSSDIESIISKLSVGDTVEFTVKRNGTTGTLSLVLEEAVPDGIASQNDENNSNGIRDNFGNDYNPYESTGGSEDFYYYFFN